MKFSPSFDSLYWARYVFDADSNYNDMYFNSLISSLTIDTSDNYYVTLNVNNYEGDTGIRIAGSDGLFFNVTPNDPMSGCMVSYNCNHEALFVRQISCVDEQYNFPKNYFYVSSEIEEESNSVFMLGMIQKDPDIGWDSHAPTFFGPDSVDLRNNAYWVRLDKSDGRMLSYGKARSATATKISGYEGDGRTARVNLTAKNNRVFAQVKYHQDIAFLDSTITMAPTSYGMGLMIWDYDGHEVEYIDYVSDGINNNCGTILLKDSTLYLSGTLYSGATFGNISISATGSSQTYLARYTDTAFMTPYVPRDTTNTDPIDTGNVRITLVDDGTALVAYPNPFRQSVRIKVQGGQLKEHNGTVTAILTDLSGRREEVRLTPDAPGQYTLDLTSRPQATYLLTLTTANGKQHTVRLLKQSDIFTR